MVVLSSSFWVHQIWNFWNGKNLEKPLRKIPKNPICANLLIDSFKIVKKHPLRCRNEKDQVGPLFSESLIYCWAAMVQFRSEFFDFFLIFHTSLLYTELAGPGPPPNWEWSNRTKIITTISRNIVVRKFRGNFWKNFVFQKRKTRPRYWQRIGVLPIGFFMFFEC